MTDIKPSEVIRKGTNTCTFCFGLMPHERTSNCTLPAGAGVFKAKKKSGRKPKADQPEDNWDKL